jgi:hypothetical protein
MSEVAYIVCVYDSDRRRRKPLAVYSELSATEAFEVAAILAALGHRGEDIAVCSDVNEAAQQKTSAPARRAS